MTPIISVVIPVCNVDKYVEECVISVMKQTFKDIEIICVDDGSNDNSLQILKRLESQDDRIKVIAKNNTGYGNSVNIGIQNCRGKYISIIESDDFIDEHMYEDLLALSDNESIDIIKANFWDYYELPNGNKINVVNNERRKVKTKNIKVTLREEPELLYGHPSIWSCLYKRKFLEENAIKFMEEAGGGWVDNPFFFETLLLAKSIIWTDKPYYHYRKTNPNSSSNKQIDLTLPLRRMIDNLNVIDKYDCNDKEILRIAYARAFMYLRGVFLDKNYAKQLDGIKFYGNKLMHKLKENLVIECFNSDDKKLYYEYLSPIDLKIPKNGKILIYNWVQFDNPDKYGGGVNVYCYNLVETILNNRPDIQVYFLSSGWSYDATTTECYIRSTHNIFGNRCRSFEVVNSPVPAAQNMILNNPEIALNNKNLKNIISKFIEDCGPFLAVHFNNIEGISLDILDLKKKFSENKFIYSVHNYIPFCITGFYYQRHNKCVCTPKHSNDECLQYTNIGRRDDISKEIYLRATKSIKRSNIIPYEEWSNFFDFKKLDIVNESRHLKEFCDLATRKINENMDYVLAVSEKVKKIALENGIKSNIIHTSYIGTKVAEYQTKKGYYNKNKLLKIGYLGSDAYFEEKGYPFLMDTLASISENDASKIDLFLTTTNGDVEKMKSKLSKFHSVTIKKGYKHTELRDMLVDVDLGVVPVLWEDNLPQIAIEMVAMGVPVLCSSFGGASELCKDELFKFKGGDKEDFRNKILYFLNNKEKLNLYWKSHTELVTMKQHWDDLIKMLEIPICKDITLSIDEMAIISKINGYFLNNAGENYKEELENIKKSYSFRVGRKITFVPRMMKKVIYCYKDNGLRYTINKILSKL